MKVATQKPIRALVVDDEADFRDLLALSLKRRGYDVEKASSGSAAMELIRQSSFDVVISDVRMPSGDGLSLLQQAKSHAKNLPIVLLVTGFNEITIEDAVNNGADALFSKPVDISVLDEAVAKILKQQNQLKEQRRAPRINTDLPTEVQNQELNKIFPARIKNISRGGMYVEFECEKCPNVNDQMNFWIDFCNSGDKLKASGVVRWARIQNAKGLFGFGVEFTQATPELKAEIESLFKKAI